MANPNQPSLLTTTLKSYTESTPTLLKILDSYLLFILSTGIIQFIYMLIVGTYPYNAFLGGFIASVGSFVLTVNLRMQSNEKNGNFKQSQERCFAEFVVSSLMLYAFAINFLG